ncbi:Os09g0325300 [Oryza sativa Japonica Group]|uniref:Os09g0325300 protein n=2 Tax=Oryza sativa subsp. japonica TaxID=39947 RepID=B7EEW3_ORYSJ|nr:unnamed protein product [Oryza sativa Japonica Group]BAG93752.1 unnamed protein product [Oryza sativa Japonica Group]BAH94502.1 Os09g0325300 [Oryza sativa Japonica Group]BAT07478.1 Os09g0325300 [Oryza sativa Japonica Group]|eukprot:NP_001175774.1 Os09g0325300 [Oryza sativa Japonica Group]
MRPSGQQRLSESRRSSRRRCPGRSRVRGGSRRREPAWRRGRTPHGRPRRQRRGIGRRGRARGGHGSGGGRHCTVGGINDDDAALALADGRGADEAGGGSEWRRSRTSSRTLSEMSSTTHVAT